MRLISRAKRDLRLLLDSAPGERFRDRYRRRQANREGSRVAASAWRLAYLGLGALVFLLGIVLFPLPGPGWATCLLGLGLVAGEYGPAARLLDGLEMLIRKIGGKLRRS